MDARDFLNTVYVFETVRQHWKLRGDEERAKAAADGLQFWQAHYELTFTGSIADELCRPAQSDAAKRDAERLVENKKALSVAAGKAVKDWRRLVGEGQAVAAPEPTVTAAELLLGRHMDMVRRQWPHEPTKAPVSWDDFHAYVKDDVRAVRERREGFEARELLGTRQFPRWQAAVRGLSPAERAAAAYQGLAEALGASAPQDSVWGCSPDTPSLEAAAERNIVRAAHAMGLSEGLFAHVPRGQQDPQAWTNVARLAYELRDLAVSLAADAAMPPAVHQALQQVVDHQPQYSARSQKLIITLIARTASELTKAPQPEVWAKRGSRDHKSLVQAGEALLQHHQVAFEGPYQDMLTGVLRTSRANLVEGLRERAPQGKRPRQSSAALRVVQGEVKRIGMKFASVYSGMVAPVVEELKKSGTQPGEARQAYRGLGLRRPGPSGLGPQRPHLGREDGQQGLGLGRTVMCRGRIPTGGSGFLGP